jgi:urease accessory protein
MAWTSRDALAADVHLTAGGAGPVGGDHLCLEVNVGPGSALILSEVSPTLLLPGPHGEESRTEIDIHVGAGATLAWLPQLVIAAQGCRHRTDVRIVLEQGARLLLHEETLFGRHGEQPGDLRQRLRVTLDGRALLDQELAIGPSAPTWEGPSVTAGNQTTGTLLLVDPGLPPAARHRDDDAAAMDLPGPGVLVTALAPDTATLRRRLDTALAELLTQQPETTTPSPGSAPPASPTAPSSPSRSRRTSGDDSILSSAI